MLVVLVTLVCVYFGTWPLTKKYGIPAIKARENAAIVVSPAPLIVRQEVRATAISGATYVLTFDTVERRYYLWLGVGSIRLPYTAELPAPSETVILLPNPWAVPGFMPSNDDATTSDAK